MTDHASRVDRIKRYLDEHRAEIEETSFGSIKIDYAGAEVTIHIGRSERLRDGNGQARSQTPMMD